MPETHGPTPYRTPPELSGFHPIPRKLQNPDMTLEEMAIQTTERHSVRSIHGVRWALVVAGILSAVFLYSLDNTIMADIQPAIVKQFGYIELLPWCSIAYVLAGTSVILPWSKIYSMFNEKYCFIVSVLLFQIGSAICGAAQNMKMFITGRAIAGGGGVGMNIGTIALIAVSTTEHERPVYLSIYGLAWAFGTVLGPLIGGAFADSNASWRWGFYINLVIGGIFAPIYLFLIGSYNPMPEYTIGEKLRKFDYLGGLLSIGAIASGVMALSFGGVLYDWGNARIIVLFALSGVLFAVFGLTQYREVLTNSEDRLFPVEFLANKTMILLAILAATAAASLYVPVFYLPLLFQFAHGDSATYAAVRLLPFVCVGIFFVFLNGGLMSKTGYYAPWFIGGTALVIVGGALMFTVDLDETKPTIYGYTVILAAGVGMYFQAGMAVAQVKAGPSKLAAATGYITLMQWTAIVFALAISGTTFLNLATDKLSKILSLPKPVIRNMIAGSEAKEMTGLEATMQHAVRVAIVESIGRVYALVIAAGALGLVVSVFLPWERIFEKKASDIPEVKRR